MEKHKNEYVWYKNDCGEIVTKVDGIDLEVYPLYVATRHDWGIEFGCAGMALARSCGSPEKDTEFSKELRKKTEQILGFIT